MRTWIDIDLDAVKANYHAACALTRARVTCVLKANAYGHGAVPIARALTEAGCGSFAVSCAREALELRSAGITGELLVMTPAEPEALPALIRGGVTLTAASAEDLMLADAAAGALGVPAVMHVKLDTGFHRLGFPCDRETAAALGSLIPALTNLRCEGLYSHLGLVSEERDRAQYARFCAMRDWLKEEGVLFADTHLCDSIGLVRYPEWHMSRCRVGAFLFGSRPPRKTPLPADCRETLALRAEVIAVHAVAPGETVGYDETPAERPLRVATVAAGYGDGYPRRLSGGRGQVLIRGMRAPVLGLICMDQLMADVTEIPGCAVGDTATLLGGGIGLQELADRAGTNRNECLTILSRRPVRVYREGGRITAVNDCLLDAGEEPEWTDKPGKKP